MTIIQEIIEGQEEIVSYFQAITSTNCFEQKARNALELLKKEQESSEPMQLQYSKDKEEYWWYESICPSCGCHWITGDNKEQCFCPHCGQKVIDKGIDS